MKKRPAPGDYLPYFETYIRLVPEGDILAVLERQSEETGELLSAISEEASAYRYAPGKWSIKELIGHLADTERVMAYRLLRAARGDATPLPGFDENLFVRHASFDRRPWKELQEDLAHVRQSTLRLLRSMEPEAWDRRGMVNGHEMTPLALACIMAGHELHHRNVLKERYAPGI